MGHGNTNALYVRASEHSGSQGRYGASSGSASRTLIASGVTGGSDAEAGFQQLPFDCCAVSLQLWKHPVCSKGDGTIFELTNIIPYLKKYGTNPATGAPLSASSLLTLHFHKNEKGRWADPISFKEFGPHTHLVAVATTGNVYAYETVQQLNIKPKNWVDLVDEQTKFAKKDLITLQDPHNAGSGNRVVSQMDHIQKGKTVSLAEKTRALGGKAVDEDEQVNLAAVGGAQSLLRKLRGDAKPADKGSEASSSSSASSSKTSAAPKGNGSPSESAAFKAGEKGKTHLTQASTTGMMAASFTSSAITPRTINERTSMSEEEYMFEQVARTASASKDKGKAYVRMTTNFGPLNIELHVDKAPKTCYNFLQHCRAGYYDNVSFHRNIPGFMLQGGDPTGTGRGGESIWGGKPFRDEYDVSGAYKHDARGVLSMANKGPGTNGSQFFFTYRATPHLDGKHTVFGRLVGSGAAAAGSDDATLRAMEKVPTEPGTDRPLRTIRILDVTVFEDPFVAFKERLEAKIKRENLSEAEIRQRDEKRKRRENDRTTWLGTELDGDKKEQERLEKLTGGVGKYLGPTAAAVAPKKQPIQANAFDLPAEKKRKTEGGGFGDFSSW